jgi:3-oxoacyl-[acyl-carrier protein] reductase
MAIDSGLRGRVVVVSGAARGIGRATAIRFAEERARVAAWDLDQPGLDALAPELEQAGGQGLVRRVDVGDAAAVEGAVAELVGRWGRVDVLINNAGIVRDAQLVKWKDGAAAGVLSDADFDAVLSANLRGVFLCTRAVVPSMIANRGGVVLSAASIVGLYGNFGQTNYAAAKAGVIAMTKTWARELGRHGIRVNAVAPGFIDTAMARGVPERALQAAVEHTPLGRIGQPEEVAEAYVWLASDRARFVHGAVLSVDGGLVLGT